MLLETNIIIYIINFYFKSAKFPREIIIDKSGRHFFRAGTFHFIKNFIFSLLKILGFYPIHRNG